MSEHKRLAFSTLDSNMVSNTIGGVDVALLKKSSQEATNRTSGFGGTNLKSGPFSDSLLSQRAAPPLTSATATASTGNERAKKTIRLNLELFGTNSDTYPEFNYSKLMHLEKVCNRNNREITNINLVMQRLLKTSSFKSISQILLFHYKTCRIFKSYEEFI